MLLTAADGLFKLDDQPFFPRFGAIPYSQIEPERWPILLDSFGKSGLNGVSAAVPWFWHEPEEHVFDFDGRSHPSRNLTAFIEACRTAGLPLIINPGPFSQAQLFAWGHPLQRERVVRWYENLGAFLKQYQSDPVIALQIDCKTAIADYLDVGAAIEAAGGAATNVGAQTNAGDDIADNSAHDPLNDAADDAADNVDNVVADAATSAAAVRFRAFLEHKYGTLEALNQVWDSSWQAWSEIRPLAPPLKHTSLHDWQEFSAQWSHELLGWLADLARHRILPVPLIINTTPATTRAGNSSSGYYGYDFTAKYSATHYASDDPFGAAMASDIAAMYIKSPSCAATRLAPPPCAARLDCVGLEGHSNITADTAVQAAISTIAHGTKAFSNWRFQMPLTPGKKPQTTENVTQASENASADSDLHKDNYEDNFSAIQATAEFIAHYEADLLTASSVLDDIAILFYEPNQHLFPEDFLFGRYAGVTDPSAFIRRTSLNGVYALLAASGFRPRFVNLTESDQSELQRCRVLFFPNLGYIDRTSYDKLVQYVEAGGILVTLPAHPKYDLSGRPLDTSALYAAPEKEQRKPGHLGLMAGWAWHLIRQRFSSPGLGLQAEPLLKTHLPALPMVDSDGRYLRGDIQQTVFVPRVDGRVLLLSPSSSEILGYSIPFDQGISAVLGTMIGGSFMFPHYYRLSETELQTLCEFCKALLARWDLAPRTKSELPVEVVYRTTPRHTYVFLINRGRARTGRFELARDLCPGAPEVIFSWGGLEADPVLLGQIQVKLAADGVVVLRYRR